ncbi:MAG: delta-60 repeat domain-containing protein [Verrucomicrobia bacterium]|nr:delta-60 repeat domain-containing protein [Verrucomicrobiota bacterium]
MLPILRTLLLGLLLFASLAPRAFAQADGTVDTNFNPPVLTYGQVNMMVRQPDGKILIAGDFTLANGVFASGLARFNADGSLDTAFAANLGTGFDSPVNQVALTSTGQIIVGGNFFTCNGTTRNTLARLNADGTLDTAWDVGNLLNFGTTALDGLGSAGSFALLPDDKILLIGTFQTVGPSFVVRNHIARFNADGTLDATYSVGTGLTLGGLGANASGGQILVSGSTTYISGSYDSCNGVATTTGLSRLNTATGAVDATFNVASGTEALSNAGLGAIDFTGRLIINGFFASFNGVARRDICRLNIDGTVDTSFNAGDIPGGSGVYNVDIAASGKIYISGGYNSVGGTPRRSYARLNEDGSLDTTFNPGSGATNGYGSYIKELSDGRVFCGGGFGAFNGAARTSMAICSSTGVTDATFLPSPGITRGNAFGSAVAVQPDGKVLVGGFFSLADSLPRQSLIRLNTDGTIDTSFNPGGVGGDNSCRAIVVRPDGKIYICGQFRSWNNVQRLRLARLNSDGTLDTSFDPGLGLNNIPYGLVEQPDGKIVVSGAFTTANGVQRNGLARFNPDGTLDTSFNPGTGFLNGTFAYSPLAIGLQSTGKILVGGSFNAYNGTAKANLIRVNADGTLDTTFTAAPNSLVRAISVLSDDRFYIGGSFNTISGTSRQRVARLNADGSLDGTFLIPSTTNFTVRAIRPLASGQIYIGGSGTTVSGQPRRQIARLNQNGTLDTTFDPGTGATSFLYGQTNAVFNGFCFVAGLAVLPTDGALFATGTFMAFGGQPRFGIVKLNALQYETFQARYFTLAEFLDPNLSGLTADPDGDGVSNLLEFAFNSNPRSASSSIRPTVSLVNSGGSFANEITFPRRLFTPGLTYIVETSSDLQTWTSGASQLSLGASDGVTQVVTFRDNTSLSVATPRRFIRLRVIRP